MFCLVDDYKQNESSLLDIKPKATKFTDLEIDSAHKPAS
jgi:hypothetical protein